MLSWREFYPNMLKTCRQVNKKKKLRNIQVIPRIDFGVFPLSSRDLIDSIAFFPSCIDDFFEAFLADSWWVFEWSDFSSASNIGDCLEAIA